MEGNKHRDNKVLDPFLFDRGGKAKRLKITSTELLVPISPITHSAVHFVKVNFVPANDTQLTTILRSERGSCSWGKMSDLFLFDAEVKNKKGHWVTYVALFVLNPMRLFYRGTWLALWGIVVNFVTFMRSTSWLSCGQLCVVPERERERERERESQQWVRNDVRFIFVLQRRWRSREVK